MDVVSLSDDAFAQTMEKMVQDGQQDVHPALAAHCLFNGTRQSEPVVDVEVERWGERNHGLVCKSLEAMTTMQTKRALLN